MKLFTFLALSMMKDIDAFLFWVFLNEKEKKLLKQRLNKDFRFKN